MRSTLVADTGVVYAALNRRDRDHARCAELLSSGVPLTLPAPVVVEVGLLGLARGNGHALTHLLDSILDGTTLVVNLDHEEYRRVRQLSTDYAALPLDIVDASVVAVAERLEETTIATLDRRHFSVVRPRHSAAFSLLP